MEEPPSDRSRFGVGPRYQSSQLLVSFKDADTEARAGGLRVERLANIESVARRKLRQQQIAGRLEDPRVPPGNRLEALIGEYAGQRSIRASDQYRVCFRWTAAGPEDVEIVDYHEEHGDAQAQGRDARRAAA